MNSEPVRLVLLYDCYGGLLTEKQRSCFDLYYNQDLSLSEIAEECGISRQGVHDTLTRTEQTLLSFENVLGCVEKDLRLREVERRISLLRDRLADRPAEAEELSALLSLIEKE